MSAHERPVSAELCCECYVCYVIKYGSHIGGTHLPTCLSSVSLPVSMAKPGSSVATRRSACEREREDHISPALRLVVASVLQCRWRGKLPSRIPRTSHRGRGDEAGMRE